MQDSDSRRSEMDDSFSNLEDHNHVSIFPVPPLEYFQKYYGENSLYSNDSPSNDPNVTDASVKRHPSSPPVPTDGFFSVFGIPLTPHDHLLRDLEVQGITTLGSSSIRTRILLKRLLWSAIAKFFELLDHLIQSPASERRASVADELQTIFINFHHILNEFRLPQAEESVVELLRMQQRRYGKQSKLLLASAMDAISILQQISSAADQVQVQKAVGNDDLMLGEEHSAALAHPVDVLDNAPISLTVQVD